MREVREPHPRPPPSLLTILERAQRYADALGNSRLREYRLTSDRHDVGLGHIDVINREPATVAAQLASGNLKPGHELVVCLGHDCRPLYSPISSWAAATSAARHPGFLAAWPRRIEHGRVRPISLVLKLL